jgi:hypothetical protein
MFYFSMIIFFVITGVDLGGAPPLFAKKSLKFSEIFKIGKTLDPPLECV